VRRVIHHPEVRQRSDGRWTVRCPECQGPAVAEKPIGIGAPVTSEFEAHMMKDNHLARQGASIR
jgi:hypothetical protein